MTAREIAVAAAAERDRQVEEANTGAARTYLETFWASPSGPQPTVMFLAVHVDLRSKLVIFEDPESIALAVQEESAGWKVHLVAQGDDGKWSALAGPFATLADLGAHLRGSG